MGELIPWTDTALTSYKSFWDFVYVTEVAATNRLTDRFRTYGQGFRITALMASATVTALAGFEGLWVRICAAIAGSIAVIFTGASAIFRVDQRVVANRKTESDLLAEGWRFVTGSGPYNPGPTSTTFATFVTNIQTKLKEYNDEYTQGIDQTPDPEAER